MNNEIRLKSWGAILAKEFGGRMSTTPTGIRLQAASDRWEQLIGSKKPICLTHSPETVDDWRERLRYCEKKAAKALISAPVGFSCSVTARSRADKSTVQTELVRFAIGLSLSVGKSCYRRYTGYYVKSLDQFFYIDGQDRLFEFVRDTRGLNLNDKVLRKSLDQLDGMVQQVEGDYKNSDPVKQEIDRLNAALTKELRDLDRLYRANNGEFAAVLGNLTTGLKGEDAIEAEYFSRLDDILRRFTVGVIVKPLSLGLVSSRVGISRKGKATFSTVPFVDGRHAMSAR